MSPHVLLLQNVPAEGSWLAELARNDPEGLASAIAVIGIAFAIAGYYTVKLWARHRERLAMIEKGLHPEDAARAAKGD